MSLTKTQQTKSLTSVDLANLKDSANKDVLWKDFGAYLDKKVDLHLNTATDTSSISRLISESIPDSSYLSQVIKYKICKSCNRPIGEQSLASHFTRCSEMKLKLQDKEVANGGSVTKRKRGKAANPLLDIEPSSVDSSRNSTPVPSTPNSSTGGVSKPKKKYKKSQTQKEKEAANAAAAAAAAAANGSISSAGSNGIGRKKKQIKPKNQSKQKGPVDVEKQCGVPLPSGGFCARSLTCKTHSMGAKRAVIGRSAPYDVLLQQYQKRNQAKLAVNNALAVQRRENAAFNEADGNDEDGMTSSSSYSKVLDPDEETHLVLEGVSKNYPMPLERKQITSTRNRHRFLYMREAYANALITSGNNNSGSTSGGQSGDQNLTNQAISGFIGGLQGRCALVNVDVPANPHSDSITQNISTITGEMYQVRAPLKAILLTSQHNSMQQQVFQKQIMKLQMQQQMQMMNQRQVKDQQTTQS